MDTPLTDSKLIATCGGEIVDADFARRLERSHAELVKWLEIVMPMAKGYAAMNRVGRNAEMISEAAAALTKAKEMKP